MSRLNREYIEAFPVGDLVHHPSNPRRGNVALIAESLEVNDQYKPLVVQRQADDGTRFVVCAGNHTLDALTANGAGTAAVMLIDATDEQALRILLVDNRASDVAHNDATTLAALLATFDGELAGTGFEDVDLDDLLALLNPPTPDTDTGDPIGDVQDFLLTTRLAIDVPTELLARFRAVPGPNDLARLVYLLDAS